MKLHRLCLPFLTGFSLAGLLLLGAAWQSATAAPSRPTAATLRYVAITGTDTGACTGPASPCRTIQYAVDQSDSGDEIRVAEGEYDDVHVRSYHYPDASDPTIVTQTVFISRSISIQGGYAANSWSAPDPLIHPTVIDTQQSGGGIYIAGDNSQQVQIAGLKIQHTTGGIFAYGVTLDLLDTVLYKNTGWYGGLHLAFVSGTLQNNRIEANTGDIAGGIFAATGALTITGNELLSNTMPTSSAGAGGLYLDNVDLYFANNLVSGNTGHNGGGMYIGSSSGKIESNHFISNTSPYNGGGIYIDLYNENLRLDHNLFLGNIGGSAGGGLYSEVPLQGDGNIFHQNRAAGGGAFLLVSPETYTPCSSRLTNTIITENWAEAGSGALLLRPGVCLLHSTIAGNTGPGADGAGVWLSGTGTAVSGTFEFTNTIIANQTTGIHVEFAPEGVDEAPFTVTLDSTLWGAGAWANGQDWNGSEVVTSTHNLWGDPHFVDPATGSYHLTAVSPAIDRGVDSGVTHDLDNDARPSGSGYDLGADEYTGVQNKLFLTVLHRRQD